VQLSLVGDIERESLHEQSTFFQEVRDDTQRETASISRKDIHHVTRNFFRMRQASLKAGGQDIKTLL
jgi:hypothetical protein